MTRFPQSGGGESIPSGIISMWSGSTSDIPEGWTLCDGTDGAPDLQGRFITGAGGNYSVGETGGSDSVQLTEDEMPSHDHSGGTDSSGSHKHNAPVGTDYTGGSTSFNRGLVDNISGDADPNNGSGIEYSTFLMNSAGNHSHNLYINNAGGDNGHENRPPYYALAFIMKV